MTVLTVYTARISYHGADRLDITRKGRDPLGVVFAPSWGIVAPVIEARRRKAPEHELEALWRAYVPLYRAEQRRAYKMRPDAWEALLGRSQATLVCFCSNPFRCHRMLCAEHLVACGAKYGGERR